MRVCVGLSTSGPAGFTTSKRPARSAPVIGPQADPGVRCGNRAPWSRRRPQGRRRTTSVQAPQACSHEVSLHYEKAVFGLPTPLFWTLTRGPRVPKRRASARLFGAPNVLIFGLLAGTTVLFRAFPYPARVFALEPLHVRLRFLRSEVDPSDL